MIEIDWDTDDDRLRRRHKASTIHGWLCMWRGTLMGNEDIRQRGRREMREARAMRAYYRERPQAKASSRGSRPFSFFRLGNFGINRNRKPTLQRHKSSGHQHHRSASRSQHHRPPAPAQRRGSSSAKNRHHQSRHAQAPQKPTRHHSSHSHKARPSNSRRPSGRR